MHTLRSRGLNPFKSSEFTLTPDGVKIRERDIRGTREGTVEYDRVGRQPIYFSHHSVFALIGAIVFAMISALVRFNELNGGKAEPYAWIFWLCVAAVFAAYFLVTRTSGYTLNSQFGTIALQGSKSHVTAFISALSDRKVMYIEDRVRQRLDVMDPVDVERYLMALQDGGVLSDDQYQQIRSEVGLHRGQGVQIGFAG